MPELKDAALRVRMLDGPPGSPRYAVTVESCGTHVCPNGVPREISVAGECTVRECALRDTVRLLLDQNGAVVQITRSGVHWG
jgi:hypothetical protein